MSATSSTGLAPEIIEPSSAHSSPTRASNAQHRQWRASSTRALQWSCIALLVVAGLSGVSSVLAKLWEIWTTDPLRSIGMPILAASVVLILLAWRQSAWELKGTWWGLLPVALAYVPAIFSERLAFSWSAGNIKISFLPYCLPIYLYACGIVLLFAGVRVWLRAWFPLALLLFSQPVPQVFVQVLDLPMQHQSAHIARSFAALLGLSPANAELLRLMFTPSFGMFIAPGCDGMRGAITMAYGALIVGYLRRASIPRWITYVAGAFFLGHIFNLFRLCALVAYYKVALGHSALEHLAKQADYVIGGALFLIAAFLFLWLVSKKGNVADIAPGESPSQELINERGATYRRIAALALLVLAAIVPDIRATGTSSESVAQALRRGKVTAKDLNNRLPAQLGSYQLVRDWQEQISGYPALEVAAYEAAAGGEVEIGIWLPPNDHSIQLSLMSHGESPKIKTIQEIATAGGQTVPFSTALYNDGVMDSLVGDTYCNSSLCDVSKDSADGIHLVLTRVMDHSTPGERFVPIFFKIKVPHGGASDQAIYSKLLSECEDFLANVNFPQLGRRFQ